jgi:hypothetical protein
MRQIRWNVTTFGHAVGGFALLSPLLTCLLLHLEFEFGRWAGGGHLPFHAWVAVFPGAVCVVAGIAAIIVGLAKLKPWVFLEGVAALLLGAVQFLGGAIILGLGSIS